VRIVAGNVVRLAPSMANTADRVLMNPPFNDPRRHNVSPDPSRRRAHVADAGLLPQWINSAARVLRDKGVVTLIWRADDLAGVLAAVRPQFGDACVLPVISRADAAAIRVLVRVVKGAPWSRRDYPGLVLNDTAGKPTREAEAVMREAGTLALAGAG
jgi:tRNA1(Val) A37 N6-methylase TrmN6